MNFYHTLKGQIRRRDYILNIQKVNQSYEKIRAADIERTNEVSKELFENFTKMSQLYKQHFEDMQRSNQQWLNLFLRPLMAKQQQY
jgi:hypothetical protein